MSMSKINSNKLIIVVTCYNNEDEVVRFVKDLCKQGDCNKITVLITCNEISDITKLKANLKDISIRNYVYVPSKNLGYLQGCFYALKLYKKIEDTDWIMISNTDVNLKSKDIVNKLRKYDGNSLVGVIAPDIELPSKKKQNPFLIKRPSKMQIKIWKTIQSHPLTYYIYAWMSIKKHHFIKKKNVSEGVEKKEIYAAHGSCFIIRGDCVKIAMQYNNKIFMYGEELFIAEVVKSIRRKIYFIPEIHIEHNENTITGKVGIRKKASWNKQSYKYLWKEFFANN